MLVVQRVLVNLYRLLTWPLWALLRRLRRGPAWVELSLHGAIHDTPSAALTGLSGVLSRLRPKPPSVAEIRLLTRRLADDPHRQGLLLTLTSLRSGWATLGALRLVLRDLVASGKKVLVLLPEGASQRELLVASAGSSVAAPRSAGFTVLGPLAQRSYVAPLLDRLGLRVQVVAQGRFKTAADALALSEMSEAEREQSSALVATLKDALGQSLDEKLGSRSRAEELFARAMFGAPEALQLGLIDQVGYQDEVEAGIGLDDETRPLSARAYLRRTAPRKLLPLRTRPRIVVLVLSGPIGDVSSGHSIGLKPTSAALKALRERDDVAGVVLHIDSPGGSAVVSDLLHREVQRLAAKKPVVAWMGNVAASGGYYLAAAARRIVAAPCTITGSIGVISAHFVAEQLMERVGVRSQVVKMTPHADLASFTRPLRDDERELLFRESERFYDRFLQVVAEGRGMTRERVAELAQGRVWSGADAERNGLVDVLGGYDTALAELRSLVERPDADFEQPLFVHPKRARGSAWGGASLRALVGLGVPAELHGALALVELASRERAVLAYSLDAATFRAVER